MLEHPIESLMMTAMNSLSEMIDVNTIVGELVETQNGTGIIPISKVSFGFAAGGSEFNVKSLTKDIQNNKLPFGGGSGAGVNISPAAFLVVTGDVVKLLTLDSNNTALDRIIDLAPDVISKVNGLIDKNLNKSAQILKIEEDS
ncbi:MAG: GerW family sporulation protein [Clostridia bacterium]|nr:GerW family sporulation protein [Clostridia bacterium]MDD4375671.1 GerW family sporulation protein [Clostridia bacterium]